MNKLLNLTKRNVSLFPLDGKSNLMLVQGVVQQEQETAPDKKIESQISQSSRKSDTPQSTAASRDGTPSQSASRQSVYEDEKRKTRDSRHKENDMRRERDNREQRSSSVDR